MPSAQSVPLAAVVCESRPSASAASSASPLRAAASISSTNPQLRHHEGWVASPALPGRGERFLVAAQAVMEHSGGKLNECQPL